VLGLLEGALLADGDAVVVVDADGRVVLRNGPAERYRDARHADALAREAIDELLAEARRGVARERELQLFGPPREVLHLRAQPIVHDAAVIGAVAFVSDVTETHRVESMRRDFVANVSHELKTPIGALALLAETMAAGGDDTTLRHLAQRIEREADRLAHIVDDLLDLSLVEAQHEPERAPVAAAALAREALDRVAPVALAAGTPVRESGLEADAVLACDRSQVVGALTNLLDNAVKYSDPGSPVELAVWVGDDAVTFVVRDEGIGVPSRDRERIFERFYRVDRARSRATGGTGLGLSIVRHVAIAHGGDVQVDSQEGEGSEFRLRLPRTTADAAPTVGGT